MREQPTGPFLTRRPALACALLCAMFAAVLTYAQQLRADSSSFDLGMVLVSAGGAFLGAWTAGTLVLLCRRDRGRCD
jgi:hypothetical protein